MRKQLSPATWEGVLMLVILTVAAVTSLRDPLARPSPHRQLGRYVPLGL